MATVTGLTADRMLAIEGASVVDGDVVGDNLILTKHDGSQINAGSVRGPAGPSGPVGTDLAVLNAIPVLDIGTPNQIRAGRVLSPADFGNLGLGVPIALWNLSDLSDVSGNGRALLNKGAVGFASGIMGGAGAAALFTGAVGQALYISDAGAADPLRFRTGSLGCWMRTAKRDTYQVCMGKWGLTNQNGWYLGTTAVDVPALYVSLNGTTTAGQYAGITGLSDVCDDRWHFIVATHDGSTVKLYVDGVQEQSVAWGMPFAGASPFNVGNSAADAATNGTTPHYGRIDEAFITADVLTEDQVRNLYCTRISHPLTVIPARASIKVRRRRRGASLIASDFPAQPLRLYNFSAGSLADEGVNATPLVNNGAALAVAGADGSAGNAFGFNGTSQSLSATDTGLPTGLATKSMGCWIKTTVATGITYLMAWGPANTGDARFGQSAGNLLSGNAADSITGPYIADGQWHFIVEVSDNASADGVKRKLYCDGKLVGVSQSMTAIALGGANKFRIGSYLDGTLFFNGQIDTPFVCNYVLTLEQILALYNKSFQALVASPKNAGDHIEGMTATDLLVTFDTLDATSQIDLTVA